MTQTKNISSTDSAAATAPPRVLFAAGGTGGHVYPAIAIADEVMKSRPDAAVLFVGTRDRMEWETVPKAGFKIKSVWISGFHRRLTPQNLLFPFKLITSLIQSFFILMRFKPQVVVACGGFAAGPIGWVAAKMGIPIVVQEQNSYPGVTNRLLSKNAKAIFTAFGAAAEFLPKEKIKLTGNPIRSELKLSDKKEALNTFDLEADKPVLLVLGGSGGALALNEAVKKFLRIFHDDMEIQLIWQCGAKYYDDLASEIDLEQYPSVKLTKYIDDMSAAYSAADLVLTRAGAGTCSELMNIGKPAIFVPSPNVAGDHQTKNANSMAETGAAELLAEEDLEDELIPILEKVIFDEDRLAKMSSSMKELSKPNAARDIAQEIFNIIETNSK